MKYFVTVAGKEHEVVVDGDQVSIDGLPVEAKLEPISGTPEQRLVLDGRSHRIAVAERNKDGWLLVDRGSVHQVEAIDERTRHIRSLSASAGGASSGATVKAPMPGLVMKLHVAEGEQVTAGQGLLVLEAMKMENEIGSPCDGVVSSIAIEAGKAVEKGAVLLVVVAGD